MNHRRTYLREMKSNSAGVLLVGRSWALSSPPKSGLAAERVKKSNERSGAVCEVKKIKWSVSRAGGRRRGNGAVIGTPVNGDERFCRSAPLTLWLKPN